MFALWFIALFIIVYIVLTAKETFTTGEQNIQKFTEILTSCGNVAIPWKTCKDAFAGLPWEMDLFKQDMTPIMCNRDGTINKAGLKKFVSCPR